MIRSIRHKGLRAYFEKGQTRGINPDWRSRLQRILTVLDAATQLADIADVPGLRFHPLKGDYAGFYAVDVSGNWRVVFRFEEGDVLDVDLVDYH